MTQIFISHVEADRKIAEKLSKELRSSGLNVIMIHEELSLGESIVEKISRLISSSDYIIFLLSSQSVKSEWMQFELGTAFGKELQARDVVIIPVVVDDCEIPLSLRSRMYLDLRHSPDAVHQLIQRLKVATRIDFSRLDARKFEFLVGDLLRELGFENVIYEKIVNDIRFDFTAHLSKTDPFGAPQIEQWIVEAKLYHEQRTDIKSLHMMLSYLELVPDYKVLLVTNGQLTSTANSWLDKFPYERKSRLRIIEGPELKKLLLAHPSLIQKYFNAGETGQIVGK
jgi:TIR domain-containing protein/restriction endonuclease